MNECINNTNEQSENIEFCPYCGSCNIGRTDDTDCYCEDCGRDFCIMTHD
jgi:NADH pyrophosphatase NudC (nudix superfamily)